MRSNAKRFKREVSLSGTYRNRLAASTPTDKQGWTKDEPVPDPYVLCNATRSHSQNARPVTTSWAI